ncbi:hypothetical protein E2C01_007870 [Portunus trituberculatus]|uniref:Uncharacterized protein n=1 Tax=Portunus trituberculatus TaxID=210409 RepID=A0A5B7CZ91_PORTR|nr:hypothetical protein [Portunus trituberculatus]
MATPNPVSGSPSGEGTRNVPRSDCSLGGDPKCLDTSINLFYINFCNIRDPTKRRCFWRFASASLGDLRRYYADFPWNDYCFNVRDPSLCAERNTEVIVSGMEAYIPRSFS